MTSQKGSICHYTLNQTRFLQYMYGEDYCLVQLNGWIYIFKFLVSFTIFEQETKELL